MPDGETRKRLKSQFGLSAQGSGKAAFTVLSTLLPAVTGSSHSARTLSAGVKRGRREPPQGSMRQVMAMLPAGAAQSAGEAMSSLRAGSARAIQGLRRAAIIAIMAAYPLARTTLMSWRDRLAEIGAAAASTMFVVAILTALGAALLLPETGERERVARALVATPPVLPSPETLRPVLPEAAPVALAVEENWAAVRRPVTMFNLEAPDIEGADLAYRVMIRGKHARRDSLTWLARADRAGAVRPLVHLAIERHETGAPTFRPFFPDLAARMAEQGLSIDRMSALGEVATKFGAVELADAVLATEQGLRPCLLYRRIESFGLAIAGWYCGSAERPADRVSFTCFLDRLDLIGAGQDRALKQHFARAERERSKACAGARRPGRKLTWLDHEAPVPALKLSQRGR
jgi:hypothetical protein